MRTRVGRPLGRLGHNSQALAITGSGLHLLHRLCILSTGHWRPLTQPPTMALVAKGSAGTSLNRGLIPVYVAPARPSHPAVAVVEMPVYTVQGEQFFVGALFRHSTGVDDDDAVGAANRAEAVRDDEGCASLHEAF